MAGKDEKDLVEACRKKLDSSMRIWRDHEVAGLIGIIDEMRMMLENRGGYGESGPVVSVKALRELTSRWDKLSREARRRMLTPTLYYEEFISDVEQLATLAENDAKLVARKAGE